MAYRDKSQGFAFAYVDRKKLLEKAKKLRNQPLDPSPETHRTLSHFQNPTPARSSQVKPKAPVQKPLPKKEPEKKAAISQLKSNLDRLQWLHHKLHAMLEDVNKATQKKKTDKDDE